MNIAKRMKLRMSELGLTQEGVAHRAGLSQGMIYKLLSEKAKGTSKLVQLSEALECDVGWLATGKTETRESREAYKETPKLSVNELKEQFAMLSPHVRKAVILELLDSLINERASGLNDDS